MPPFVFLSAKNSQLEQQRALELQAQTRACDIANVQKQLLAKIRELQACVQSLAATVEADRLVHQANVARIERLEAEIAALNALLR
jgi:allophanate hydrolase subunit 1